MKKLYMQFRIGEKIAFSFGIVGLLFLSVIWQYHQTLESSLADYQRLQKVFAARQGHALMIENHMLQARRAERDFLLHRDPLHAAAVNDALHQVLVEADALSSLDAAGAASRDRIQELVATYRGRFKAVVDAWQERGLDHNSGLQGAFRKAAHRLQDQAIRFKVGGLYQQLLQIGRNERDLGLSRDPHYRDEVLGLIGGFETGVTALDLQADFKQKLLQELAAYRHGFVAYANALLDLGAGETGDRRGMLPAARRIEALLKSYMIPDFNERILEVRRREKDYLLRGDQGYVEMVIKDLAAMRAGIGGSLVSETDKAHLGSLLDDYERDFLALVEQDRRIVHLQDEMREAVAEVARLVRGNVQVAERDFRDSSTTILAASSADARFMLWLAGLAALLGVISVVIIILSVGRPLKRMAGVLAEVAYEEPLARIEALPGGRDEVNLMAQTVNAMADNKLRFINWWQAAIREAEARECAAAEPGSRQLQDELEQAHRDRRALSDKLHEEIRDLIQTRWLKCPENADAAESETAAKSALAILDVLRSGERRRRRGQGD